MDKARAYHSIAHVDMDAFFAAIEQRDDPRLRGKPVIVGSDPKGGKGRGVVSTCSYEARAFGIRSAMPISLAYQKCPHGAYLPVDMEKYHAVSVRIHKIFGRFTPDIEPVSIDEAFLDITGSAHLFTSPRNACVQLKKTIMDETGLTASVGLAPTMMAAKIASDLKKPDGLVEVAPDGLLDFLWPLDIRRIWGLGPRAEEVLKKLSIHTIGDLAHYDRHALTAVFGAHGEHYWLLANGIDERTVETRHETKSVSSERTFDVDTDDPVKIESVLASLCEEVSTRLRREGLRGRTITLKYRFDNFDTSTRAATMDVPTNFFDVIYKAIKTLYNESVPKSRKIRLLGVKASKFASSEVQDSLFTYAITKRNERVHAAIDTIKTKFGDDAICRAETLHDNTRRR